MRMEALRITNPLSNGIMVWIVTRVTKQALFYIELFCLEKTYTIKSFEQRFPPGLIPSSREFATARMHGMAARRNLGYSNNFF